MKKSLSILLMLVTCVTYILSTMGYGVHECSKSGSRDVILLFGETPCEYVHSHIDKHGHIYTHAHEASGCNCSNGCNHSASCNEHTDCCSHEHETITHDSNCCHTSVYTVTVDQTVSDNSNLLASSANFIFIPTPICGYIQPHLLTQSTEFYWILKQKEKLCEDNIYLVNSTFLV